MKGCMKQKKTVQDQMGKIHQNELRLLVPEVNKSNQK